MSENEELENEVNPSDADIIEIAKERFKQAEDAEMENRQLALDDLRFRAGEQWPADVLAARKRANRPAITINKIPQFVQQITNEMRQNKPSIKVYPVDDGADIETARVLQGMVRNIEYSSNAEVAYINAGSGAVEKSFGFFRIAKDYVDNKSFEQELQIKQIANHFSVYIDPASQEPDGSDANWGFVFDEISKYEFKAQYPKAEASRMSDWGSIGAENNWFTKNTCRVAEYFYKEFRKVMIYQIRLEDGATIVVDSKQKKEVEASGFPFEVLNERETLVPTVMWCKFNGVEILEKTEWGGTYIPIIPVYGARFNLEGKWRNESVFRFSKDSQRMLNYFASNEVEAIALAPKAPFIVAEGQIPPEYQPQWQTANVESHAFLTYKAITVGGQPVGAPQRNHYEPAIQAITSARIQANDDIKATTGIYDASLGARSNEQSGIAIQQRAMQAQNSNYHFIDNLARSIQHAGRILVEQIPIVYDTARIQRIIGETGEQELVKINQPFEKGGQEIIHDMSKGKYDVVVDVGPSYETKRQESVATMLELMKVMPQQSAVIVDLLVKNMDIPNNQELADRLQKTLPAGIIEDKEKQPIPPEVQAQMDQMGQMIEQLTGQLNKSSEAIKMKAAELESRERIEFAKLEHNASVELAKIHHKEAMTIFSEDMAMIKNRLSYLDMDEPIEEDLIEENPNEHLNEAGAMGAEPQLNNEQGYE